MVAMGGGLSVSPFTRPRARARMSITGKMGTYRHHRHPAEGCRVGRPDAIRCRPRHPRRSGLRHAAREAEAPQTSP